MKKQFASGEEHFPYLSTDDPIRGLAAEEQDLRKPDTACHRLVYYDIPRPGSCPHPREQSERGQNVSLDYFGM
jgi:hypothetical protein